MDRTNASAGYWVAAIILVLLAVGVLWWANTRTVPLVPNTGDTVESTVDNMTDGEDDGVLY
jgi:hypothetical protein